MDKALFNAYVAEHDRLAEAKSSDYGPLNNIHHHILLSALIQPYPRLCAHVQNGISIGVGWVPLIEEACAEITKVMEANSGFNVIFMQIKEKFGYLRAYTAMWSDQAEPDVNGIKRVDQSIHLDAMEKVRDICWDVESRSETICEVCGEPGKQSSGPWIKTVCDKHLKK